MRNEFALDNSFEVEKNRLEEFPCREILAVPVFLSWGEHAFLKMLLPPVAAEPPVGSRSLPHPLHPVAVSGC